MKKLTCLLVLFGVLLFTSSSAYADDKESKFCGKTHADVVTIFNSTVFEPMSQKILAHGDTGNHTTKFEFVWLMKGYNKTGFISEMNQICGVEKFQSLIMRTRLLLWLLEGKDDIVQEIKSLLKYRVASLTFKERLIKMISWLEYIQTAKDPFKTQVMSEIPILTFSEEMSDEDESNLIYIARIYYELSETWFFGSVVMEGLLNELITLLKEPLK